MSLPSFIRPFVGSEIRTVEMHTSGEPARIVYAGYPDIPFVKLLHLIFNSTH